MKNIIKITILSVLLLFAFSARVDAQNRRSNSKQERTQTKSTNRIKTTNGNRVRRSRVVYRKPERRIAAVRTLPSTARVITHNGLRYHYVNGHYYRNYGGRYIIVTPGIGLRVRTLPIGYISIFIGPRQYFYFDGIYYLNVDDVYEVRVPEIGMIVSQLPQGYEKVVIDGQIYYEYNNVLYKKIYTNDGKAYEVVGIIE